MIRDICITGGTGFLGKHLANSLLKQSCFKVHVLIREKVVPSYWRYNPHIQYYQEDLSSINCETEFIKKNSILIHLAYNEKMDNVAILRNLLDVSSTIGIKRFIHCSTAVLIGKSRVKLIDENIECQPQNIYEKIKYKLENEILEENWPFEVCILRPTAVFGVKGKNLVKLARDLSTGSRFFNYLKSCVYNNRSMNLVAVENVVGGLVFLSITNKDIDKNIYIVSDDEYRENTFRNLEKILMNRLSIADYSLTRITCPVFVLNFILKIIGQSNTNAERRYSSRKIESIGYRKEIEFLDAIYSFCDYYVNDLSETFNNENT